MAASYTSYAIRATVATDVSAGDLACEPATNP
jgi:hypothetical protein